MFHSLGFPAAAISRSLDGVPGKQHECRAENAIRNEGSENTNKNKALWVIFAHDHP